MRQIFRYLFSLSILVIGLAGCKSQEDIEEATLELSTASLTFAEEASDKTITVTTNRSNWTATSPQEATWVVLSQQGNILTVHAKANTLGEERVGSVIVNAGGEQRRVSIRQSAAGVVLDTEVNQVTFTVEGGKQRVTYAANVEDLKIELGSEINWLTLEHHLRGSFTLTAQPNIAETQRTAKVILTAGKVIHEIEVVQHGTVHYILPLQKFPASLQEVIRFERARFSEHTRTGDRGDVMLYRYATQSVLMPLIEYEYEGERSKGYQAVITLCVDDKYVRDNKNFEEYLKANGYEKDNTLTSESQDVYRHETLPLNLNVAFDASGVALLETVYIPRQTGSFPTFTKLPLEDRIPWSFLRVDGLHGTKKEAVREQEAIWGGTLDDVLSNPGYDLYHVTADKSLEGEVVRGYFYIVKDATRPDNDDYVGEVSAVQSIFADVKKGFWQDGLGRFHLTQELAKLLNDNGYNFVRTLNGGYEAFYNAKKMYAYVVHQAYTEGRPSLEIQGYRIKLQATDDNSARAHITQDKAYQHRLLDRRRELIRQIQHCVDQTRRLQGHR